MDQTYKIIGGDGQEYGPVSLVELKDWIVSGRVAAATQVWSSESGRWIPAVKYSELQPEIGQVAALGAQLERSAYLVGFWPRLGAYIVDSAVLFVLCALILGPFTDAPQRRGNDLEALIEYWKAYQPRLVWEIVLSMVYTVFMTGQMGATVGKLLIGARIIRMDGSPIGFGVALYRWLASVLSSVILGIGYLFIAFRPDRRGLHDLIAGTQVIYVRPRSEG